ncbi:MAG: hypothetical protein JWM89_199 [Acidimicrobiales bacterium]|nr:hypothetical protein [Acidimicrobiales bacterium]
MVAIPVEERPLDESPIHTVDLPDTPQRDSAIAASSWIEAPEELLHLGDDIGTGPARYLRRIGPWLLWRSGPPRGADARYWVALATDLDRQFTFHLFPDGTGEGAGPTGEVHDRFRAWKEDLRDNGEV